MLKPTLCALAVMAVLGCGSYSSKQANPSVMNEDPVREVRTVVHLDTGPEDLGMKKWRASTELLMREIPMASFSVNDEGYLVSFSPAFPPVPGVNEPPTDVAIKYLEFNARGQLSGWALYGSGEVDACTLKKLDNTPPIPPTYYCSPNNCDIPNLCTVNYEYNEGGTLKRIYCTCEASP